MTETCLIDLKDIPPFTFLGPKIQLVTSIKFWTTGPGNPEEHKISFSPPYIVEPGKAYGCKLVGDEHQIWEVGTRRYGENLWLREATRLVQ